MTCGISHIKFFILCTADWGLQTADRISFTFTNNAAELHNLKSQIRNVAFFLCCEKMLAVLPKFGFALQVGISSYECPWAFVYQVLSWSLSFNSSPSLALHHSSGIMNRTLEVLSPTTNLREILSSKQSSTSGFFMSFGVISLIGGSVTLLLMILCISYSSARTKSEQMDSVSSVRRDQEDPPPSYSSHTQYPPAVSNSPNLYPPPSYSSHTQYPPTVSSNLTLYPPPPSYHEAVKLEVV